MRCRSAATSVAVCSLVALVLCFGAASARADAIIKIKGAQACAIIGLDSSPATAQGGVHCDTGNTGFSLTGILNGTIALYVGNSKTPSWNVLNDTGVALTSLTLYFSGALASNQGIDMQQSGGKFVSCVSTTANNIVNSDAACGTGDKTPLNPALAVQLVWSGGTGIGINGTFNINTASFAHAGQDAGCISGTSDCSPVQSPEPASLVLLGSALAGAGLRRRLFRK